MLNILKYKKILIQKENNSFFYILILLLIYLTVTTKGILSGDAWYSDASRHTMNGVFFLDLIKDFPLKNLYQYAITYYTKYPALSIGYHPPFFPIIEVLFFAIGGVSFLSARITVLFFGILALIFWYRLIHLLYFEKIAFFSSIFIITSPLFVHWSRIPMLELPALAMIIISTYAYMKYLKYNQLKHLYLFFISLGLSILTKQTAIFLFPAFFIYLILVKKMNKFMRKGTILPMLIFIFLLVSFILMTLKFGKANITQINMDPSYLVGKNTTSPSHSFFNLMYYPRQLLSIFSFPIFFLSLIGIMISIKKIKSKINGFFLLWIIFYYAMITYIGIKEQRYAFFWIPPFSFFATLALFRFKIVFRKVNIILAIVIIFSGFQTVRAYNLITPYISGYENAAKYVINNPKGCAILLNIYFDGNFIFHYKKHDNGKMKLIIRGEKFFREFYKKNMDTVDLIQLIRDHGIKYVIIESESWENVPYSTILKKCLNTEYFVKRKELKISSNFNHYKNSKILIYELIGEAKFKKETITLHGWRFGREVYIPLEWIEKFPN